MGKTILTRDSELRKVLETQRPKRRKLPKRPKRVSERDHILKDYLKQHPGANKPIEPHGSESPQPEPKVRKDWRVFGRRD